MPRSTNSPASRRRKKRKLKLASGFYNSRGRLYKLATFTLLKALRYAYRDRLARKRDFRRLWITRIGAATKMQELSYSRFMAGLKKAGINLNRKILADLAVNDKEVFSGLVETAKKAL
jgi:large subunit ribosomal protein L20